MQAIVLAAGKGTRMRSQKSKVLHEIFNKPILGYVLDGVKSVGVKKPTVVIGNDGDRVRSFIGKSGVCAIQRNQLGTGHAVIAAKKTIKVGQGDVLIVPGDMPLIRQKTFKQFVRKHKQSKNAVSILTSIVENPTGYGRILRKGKQVSAIREELDANLEEKKVNEVNTGVYLFSAKKLLSSLSKITSKNKKNEFYLTDTISILVEKNEKVQAYPIALEEESLGVNNRRDLAQAIKSLNQRTIMEHLDKGVTIVDPAQTYIAPDVKIGKDTIVYPFTVIDRDVVIGNDCEIGPFAKIRSGSQIGSESVIGSFVEINRSKVASKVVAKHLAYIGDAVIHENVNVGAGVVTANYDGKKKHKTIVGKGTLLGSNTVLVAPVNIGENSKTGAGTVVKAKSVVKKGQLIVGVPGRVVTPKKSQKNMAKDK